MLPVLKVSSAKFAGNERKHHACPLPNGETISFLKIPEKEAEQGAWNYSNSQRRYRMPLAHFWQPNAANYTQCCSWIKAENRKHPKTSAMSSTSLQSNKLSSQQISDPETHRQQMIICQNACCIKSPGAYL